MRIASLMHGVYRLEGSGFVIGLYRQLLNREPDEQELASRIHQLEIGAAKAEMIAGIVSSGEARQLYDLPHDGTVGTAADKIRFILQTEDAESFLNMLYAELLCRFAEDEEYEWHRTALEQGADRVELIRGFCESDEWVMLLQGERSVIDRRTLAIFMTSR